jgi:hypothetical protein
MLITILPPLPLKPEQERQIERAAATWAGRVFEAKSTGGATPELARKLIAAGCPDQPWQAQRHGAIVMSGPSLAGIAGIRYVDGDKRLDRVNWKPHPHAQPAPAMPVAA